MKNYTITVNGNVYEVTVEEGFSSGKPTVQPVTQIQKVVPSIIEAPEPITPQTKEVAPVSADGEKGNVLVNAPMPGKILSIKENIGGEIKRGQVILILEAMKMENEIVAPEDGILASVDVTVGQSVESGDILATLK